MEFTLLSLFSDWSLLGLRIVLGIIFLAHGVPKIKNLKQTATWFSSVGFKPGMFWAPLVALVEFFGALLILAGFWVEYVAVVFLVQFVVIIIWKLATRQKLVGNLEVDLLVFGALLILLTMGSGSFSIVQLFSGNL
jgi:putative oxidoreductase